MYWPGRKTKNSQPGWCMGGFAYKTARILLTASTLYFELCVYIHVIASLGNLLSDLRTCTRKRGIKVLWSHTQNDLQTSLDAHSSSCTHFRWGVRFFFLVVLQDKGVSIYLRCNAVLFDYKTSPDFSSTWFWLDYDYIFIFAMTTL